MGFRKVMNFSDWRVLIKNRDRLNNTIDFTYELENNNNLPFFLKSFYWQMITINVNDLKFITISQIEMIIVKGRRSKIWNILV